MSVERKVGYLQVLKQNRDFRNLWLGQSISQLGDWLAAAALYSLVESLTHSGRAVAFVLVLQFLPYFLLSPITGIFADRFPRRTIMIAADLGRVFTVLGVLFVRRPEDVWIIYVLIGLTDILSAFFEPARQATIPSICKREELFSANAVSSLTWSMTLTVGAGVGALLTLAVGRELTFVLDALSFILSAFFIWRIRATSIQTPSMATGGFKQLTGSLRVQVPRSAFRDGIEFLKGNPVVVSFLFVKAASGLGSGFLVLFTLFGQRIFPVGKTGAAIALLYAARGLGTAIGPFLSRRFIGETPRALQHGIGWAFVIYGFFYIVFGQSANLWVAMTALTFAHIGGSIQWVNSTMLLQLTVPDRYRGRVFAWEWGFLTLASAFSNYMVGWLIDVRGVSPREAATGLGLYLMLPAFAWAFLQFKWSHAFHKPDTANDSAPPPHF